MTRSKYIRPFDQFKMNEAFLSADGKPVSQKDIVNGILFAMTSLNPDRKIGKDDYEKFKDQISKMQKDEKTIQLLFNNYRPVSQLNASAFMWMVNKIYNNLVEDEYQRFNIQIINRIGVNIDLRDQNVAIGQVPAGGTVFVTSGPYRYNNSPGFYYERSNSLEKGKVVDLEIILTPTHWEMDPKTQVGDKVFNKLIKDKTSFDLYSGYFEKDKFFFKLFKFNAPKAKLEPVQKQSEKPAENKDVEKQVEEKEPQKQ